MPKFSFIILTYNSSKYIDVLIESLNAFFSSQISSGKIEVIIVDNNSTDDTLRKVENLKKKNSYLKLVENKQNLGFAKGINFGVLNSTGEYLCFINPDAEFKNGNLEDIEKLFNEKKNLGVVGGRIYTKNGNSEKSTGQFLGLWQILLMSLGLDEVFNIRKSPERTQYVNFVSGGFMFIPKDLFVKLGGFDENFFMYVEDVDLCYRVNKEGKKVLFFPDVSIIHESHGSSSRGFAIKNIYKGILYYQKKNANPISYILVKAILMLKAYALVLIGKMLNNRYLIETYTQVLKV